MAEMKVVYVPCKDKEEAKKIARYLVEKKLVACANIHPIESVYQWEGEVVEESEVVLLLKTVTEKVGRVKEGVKGLHSYSVPCIAAFTVDVNEEYGKWMNGVIN